MKSRSKGASRILAAVSCLVASSLTLDCASTGAPNAGPGLKRTEAALTSGYPACVSSSVEKASRFDDPDYFRLMLSNGVAVAPPQRLFERMKAAAAQGETYKALYFARLLTSAQPDLAGGWANRAALAGSLGLKGEQAAAASNAGKPAGEQVQVPAGFVPGTGLAHRPSSLADWAAAMSLLADDTAMRAGGTALVAVRDDVSGLQTVRDGDAQYAVSKPLAIDDLLPNSFVLVNARAMSEHNTDGGKMALSIFMAALGGVNAAYGNAANSAALSDSAGRLAGEASVVASHWKGGSFTARTYADGQVKNADEKPKPAGEYQAVGMPQPLIWASGGSLRPTAMMALVQSGGDPAKIRTRRFAQAASGASKEQKVPTLMYPRLESLCHASGGQWNCTVRLAAMELMLNRADVEALVADPAAASRLGAAAFGFGEWEGYYAGGEPIVLQAETNRASLIGYDQQGFCYEVSSAPNHWFASPAPGR